MHTGPSGSENIAATRLASVATRSLPAMMYGTTRKWGIAAAIRRLLPAAVSASSTTLPGVPRGATSKCGATQ